MQRGTPPSYWVHDLDPFLVQFGEGFGIRYYGLAYLLGFAAAALLLRAYAKAGRSQLSFAASIDLVFALVIGVIIGGRLGFFLLYQPQTLLRDPLALVRLWEGGMASHGGFIGVTIALWWFARSRKVSMLHLGDLIATTAPAGLFFGRVANFINGELWGRITDVPWAVIFPQSMPGEPPILIPPRHPSQLYEAGLEGLLLLAVFQWRFWKTDIARRAPGQIAGEFLLAYAIVRMLGERFREADPHVPEIMGLNAGAFYSIFLIVAGIAVILWARRTAPANARAKK